MWPATDDGSNYDKVALDRNDPNYDPDEVCYVMHIYMYAKMIAYAAKRPAFACAHLLAFFSRMKLAANDHSSICSSLCTLLSAPSVGFYR
jgi:hypothetical protein